MEGNKMTVLDRARDIEGTIHIMRLATAHSVGGDKEECQDFIACILPELIRIEKRLSELVTAIDSMEIDNTAKRKNKPF